jgi:hypothetical protein
MKRIGLLFSVLAASVVSGISEEILIAFEQAEIGKPVTNWVEKGVVFTLAPPTKANESCRTRHVFPSSSHQPQRHLVRDG